MTISFFFTIILAIALPSLRISSLLKRIVAIVLLYTAALYLGVVYIQSIGSGIGVFSGLFHVTLISQSIETFVNLVGALILMPGPDTLYPGLMVFSLVPVKPDEKKPSGRLTKEEREAISLSPELKQIIVGLTLGDLYIFKQKLGINPCLKFEQGICHSDYIFHLFDCFKDYCSTIGPKTRMKGLSPTTGKEYGSIGFQTFSLPCFKEFYELFYVNGVKVVPSNIGALLTLLGLAYWICDDGTWDKIARHVRLCTHSFTLAEVNLLADALNNKWDLKCYVNKHTSGGFIIIIPSYSVPHLQGLLKDIMPPMMLHKIGL